MQGRRACRKIKALTVGRENALGGGACERDLWASRGGREHAHSFGRHVEAILSIAGA